MEATSVAMAPLGLLAAWLDRAGRAARQREQESRRAA